MPPAERVQVQPGADYVPTRPAPIPGSTYVAPGDNALLRISSALGEVRPALAQFGAAYIQDQQKRQGEEAQSTVPLMKNKDVFDAYKGGKLPGMDAPESIADITSRKLTGARAADEVQNGIKVELAEGKFDWEKGNVNDFVREHMRKRATDFQGDRFALSGFLSSMEGFPEKISALRTQQATAMDQQKRENNTFEAISLTADKAIEAGASPQDVFKAVRGAQVAVSGPNGSQGIDFATSDKYVIQKAAQLVSSGKINNVEAGVALLTEDRAGADGAHVPALANAAQHQETIRGILQSAVRARKQHYELTARNDITSQDANTILSEKGSLIGLTDMRIGNDDEGKPKTFTADQRQKAAVTEYVQRLSPAHAKERRETPQQTFDRELSNLAVQGVDHPVWKDRLEAAIKGSSLNELTNPVKRDGLISASNLYDNLREKNPQYLKGLVNSQTQDFFEVYRVAKTLTGTSMEQALEAARRATIDISPEREDTLKSKYREIEQAVSSASPSSRFWSFFNGAPANSGYVQQELIRAAKLYARLDLGPAEAVEAAKQRVKETSIRIGNSVLPKLSTQLPQDFPEAVEAYKADFIKKYGKQNDVSASDVGLAYNGAGAYTLINQNTGMSLTTPSGVAHFTLKDLSGHIVQKKDERRAVALKDAEESRAQEERMRHSPLSPESIRSGLGKLINEFRSIPEAYRKAEEQQAAGEHFSKGGPRRR